jgi:hypothetical protein
LKEICSPEQDTDLPKRQGQLETTLKKKKEKSRLSTPIWIANIRMASAHTAHHPTSTQCSQISGHPSKKARCKAKKCLLFIAEKATFKSKRRGSRLLERTTKHRKHMKIEVVETLTFE